MGAQKIEIGDIFEVLCIIRILKKTPLHNQCHLEMISSLTFK